MSYCMNDKHLDKENSEILLENDRAQRQVCLGCGQKVHGLKTFEFEGRILGTRRYVKSSRTVIYCPARRYDDCGNDLDSRDGRTANV
jgi:hypothetical protein